MNYSVTQPFSYLALVLVRLAGERRRAVKVIVTSGAFYVLVQSGSLLLNMRPVGEGSAQVPKDLLTLGAIAIMWYFPIFFLCRLLIHPWNEQLVRIPVITAHWFAVLGVYTSHYLITLSVIGIIVLSADLLSCAAEGCWFIARPLSFLWIWLRLPKFLKRLARVNELILPPG